MKRAVLPLVVVGIVVILAILLVIGLTVGDKTDQEQEEDRQDGAPALVLGEESAALLGTGT
jgi:hypothetical protein